LVQKRLLTEIVTSTVGETELAVLGELLDTTSLHEVEELSGVSWVDNGVASLDFDEFQTVGDLGSVIWVNLFKELKRTQKGLVSLSLFTGSFLDDIVETGTIQGKAGALGLGLDRRSSGSIIQKSQLTETHTGLVGQQESWLILSFILLKTIKLTIINNIEVISIISLDDDIISSFEMHFLHGHDDNLGFLGVETRKHEGLIHSFLDSLLLLVILGDHTRLVVLPSVVGAEDLS